MLTLAIASVICLSVAETPAETYADAHRVNAETGRPMVVLVGAEWCPACQTMEKQVVPKMRERGLLKRIAFALVDLDHDRDLGRSLTSGGPIPQLIFFRRTREGWTQRKVIGGQSLEAVEQLIDEEIAANKVEMQAVAKSKESEKARPTTAAKPASLSKSAPAAKDKAAKASKASDAEKKQAAHSKLAANSDG